MAVEKILCRQPWRIVDDLLAIPSNPAVLQLGFAGENLALSRLDAQAAEVVHLEDQHGA